MRLTQSLDDAAGHQRYVCSRCGFEITVQFPQFPPALDDLDDLVLALRELVDGIESMAGYPARVERLLDRARALLQSLTEESQ